MNKVFEDILMLVKAGYSKEEIDDIMNEKRSAETEEKESEQKDSEEKEPKTDNDALLKFQKSLDDFGKKLEAFNILNSSMGEEKEVSAEDALAKILNPEKGV